MTVSSSLPGALAPRRPAVLADLLPGSRALARDAALVLVAAGFVGILAQLVVRLPFTPVPITGQTLGVVLAGCALGARRALLAMGLYIALGIVGLPWFAGHTSGWPAPNGGYLVGFVVTATVCGALAERGWDRSVQRAVGTMVLGEVVLYAIGVPWLAVVLHVSLAKAFALGCTPFLIGDAIKLAGAAALLPLSWRLARTGGTR